MAKPTINKINNLRNAFRAGNKHAKKLIANSKINDAYESTIGSNAIIDNLLSGITAVKDAVQTGDISGAFSNQFMRKEFDEVAKKEVDKINFGKAAMGLSGAFMVGRAGLGAARGMVTDSSGNADVAGIPFI
jgi:hypothetical protein